MNNEYGVPLHACNGYRQDEHYWAWLATKSLDALYERARIMYERTN